MEYHDLVRAQLDDWNRTATQIARSNEARRLNGPGRSFANPIAHFDSLVLRVSRGAAERQARRVGGSKTPEPMA